jgi:hypothetical protein
MKTVVAGVLAAVLSAPLAFGQPAPAQPAPAPAQPGPAPATLSAFSGRFQIDTGYFGLTADDLLRYKGPQGGSGEVSLENDLGLNDHVATFWVDATWRVGRRHTLKLGFTRFNRDRADYALQRDFTWGGETYYAGMSATTSSHNAIVGGYYRFAVFRNDRFEIGPTIGIGYLKLEARIQATGIVNGPAGPESQSRDESASTTTPTGALGAYAAASPARRIVVRGDYLYIKATLGDAEASVTDWRLGAYYFFARNAGLGVQYKLNRYSYDPGPDVSKLSGQVTFQGVQVFASFRF